MAEEGGTRQIGKWIALGGALASGPAAAGWGEHETEVWAVHRDGRLLDRYWDGHEWHDWKELPGPPGVRFTGQPAAAARDKDLIDVLVPGDDGQLWHKWWDGIDWVSWRVVEGAPQGVTAVAAAWSGGRLDVYARAEDGALWYVALTR